MEHHGSKFTEALNHALGTHLSDAVVLSTVVFVLLTIVAILGGRSLSLRAPGGIQQVLELVVAGFTRLVEDTIPHHARKHLPIMAAFGAFILVGNLLANVPGMGAPTSNYSVTFALAITSFVYYNQACIREVGLVHYLKHFMGPVLALAPLMFLIEIVGHVARIASLSLRLFGNLYGEHAASGVFYGFLHGYLVPLPLMALGLLAAVLQAFIFCLLSMLYIALGTEH